MNEQLPLLTVQQRAKNSKITGYYLPELSSLACATLPIALSFGLQNAVQAFSILMVGNLGTFELAVASYGYMFASCTGSMVAIGGATALDTLCGQAFASEVRLRNPYILGTYLPHGILVLSTLFLLVILPLWWFSDSLFIVLGQEQDFAVATGSFLRFLIPAGLLQVVAECLKKFLQVQGHSYAVGWIVLCATVIGILMNVIILRVANTGLWGAALATTIYHLATNILLGFYILSNTPTRTAIRITKEVFVEMKPMTMLSLIGILTIATEWWSFEILAMMAARLDSISIATQSILMASDLIFTTVSLGLGVATSHRIGHLLGSNNIHGARDASHIPYMLSVLFGLVEFIVIMALRNIYGQIFTDDKAVIDYTARILPLMAGFQIMDLANGGAGGILRGAGKNHLSGACNLVAYYGVGLTSAQYFCFHREMGLFGLWLGIISGSLALLAFQTLCVALICWEQVASKVSLENM